MRIMLRGTPKSRMIKVPTNQEEKHQDSGIETGFKSHPVVRLFVLSLEKLQKNRHGLQRINNGQ